MNASPLQSRLMQAIEHRFGSTRGVLRFLAVLLVLLSVLVMVIPLGVLLSDSESSSEAERLLLLGGALTLLSIAFLAWTFRRAEASLLAALKCQPPHVLGARRVEIRSRHGIAPGLSIQTHDRRVWQVPLHAPLVDEAVAWLASVNDNGADREVKGVTNGFSRWPTQPHLPSICAHCAKPTDRYNEVGVKQRGGTTLMVALPQCRPCYWRQLRRRVVGGVVFGGSIVLSMIAAPQLFPPGYMRGALIGAVVAIVSISLYLGNRLLPMIRAIEDQRGGAPGEGLYVKFGNEVFEQHFRRMNEV